MIDATSRVVLLAAVVASAVTVGAARKRPVARVVDVRGTVTAMSGGSASRTLKCFGTVYAGETLNVQANSSLSLAFRSDGHLESLQKAGEVTVTEEGCKPVELVRRLSSSARQKRAVGRIVDDTFAGGVAGAGIVKGAYGDSVAGASILRGGDDAPQRRLRPVQDSIVLSSKPEFEWLPGCKDNTYEILVFDENSRILWRETTTSPRLKYAGKQSLEHGTTYGWELSEQARDGQPKLVCEGRFTIATSQQIELAAPVCEMATAKETALVCLAAMWFKRQGMIDEALSSTQRLVELVPEQAAYHLLLSELLERAERNREAKQSLQKARQLAVPERPRSQSKTSRGGGR